MSTELHEERLRDFAEIAASWFWELDDQLRFSYLSDKVEGAIGLASDALLGRSVLSIPAGDAEMQKIVIQKFEARTPFENLEFPWLIGEQRRVLSISGRPIFDRLGEFKGYRGIGRDITSEYFSLKAARDSEQKLRVLVDALPVCISFLDKDLRYQLNNETYRTWFGTSPESLIGKRIDKVLGESVFEEARLALECALEGETIDFDSTITDVEGQARDVHTTVVPHRPSSGEVDGLFVLTSDVTEQKQRQERLSNTLRYLGAVLDGLDVALVVLDSNANISMTNAAWQQLRDSLIDGVFDEHSRYSEVCRAMISTEQGGTTGMADQVEAYAYGTIDTAVNMDVQYHTTQRLQWISISTSEFWDENERFVLVVHRNITEGRLLRGQLRDRDRLLASISRLNTLGELTGTIAHELNQPLTSIGNYATLAQSIVADEYSTDKTLQNALSGMVKECRRAGSIVHRVNSFVRQQPVKCVPVKIDEVVNEVVSFFDDRARKDGITFNVFFPSPVPSIMLDKVQFEQLLYNLCDNSMEAILNNAQSTGVSLNVGAVENSYESDMETEHTVTIRVSVLTGEEQLLFSVSDSGPGVPAELLDNLFMPFVSSSQNGLGLGLAICRSIVESHEGSLWYEARTENTAGRFCFRLPQRQPESQQ